MPRLPPDTIIEHAKVFATAFSSQKHPLLLGVTDGKAVGTYIEAAFKQSLRDIGIIEAVEGNAAKGIDLPSFGIDIKVTSVRQPQSSSPFGSFKQKVEGLGYDLLVFVYAKLDEAGQCKVEFVAVRYIPARLTADYQTTRTLRRLILEEDGNADDVFAFLIERNIPADETTLFEYAKWLIENPPEQGYLTISNALQWRLQYGRVVAGGIEGVTEIVSQPAPIKLGTDPLGDFQTPPQLAAQIWRAIDVADTELLVEPTVGEGVFLATAPACLDRVPWVAWDINAHYVTLSRAAARKRGLRAQIHVGDAFAIDRDALAASVRGKAVLAIGNPPWVTNSDQSSAEQPNLPRKWNRFGLHGLDAITGKANFDIAEAVLLSVLGALAEAREIRLAFLVKRSVALKMSRDLLGTPGLEQARFARIDAQRWFSASVEAGLLELIVRPGGAASCNHLSLASGLGLPAESSAGRVQRSLRWECLGVQGGPCSRS